MTTITRQQVRAALDALRVGRNGALWRSYVRRLLHNHGGGAPDIEHLQPQFFAAVFAAAGGNIAPAMPSQQVFRHGGKRIRQDTPLMRDLERRLREGVKHPRPTGRIDFGNPTLAGERRD